MAFSDKGQLSIRDANTAKRLTAVRVRIAREIVGRSNDGLRHAQRDVGAHEVDNQVEHVRPVDQVDERLPVWDEVTPVHTAFAIEINRVFQPVVVADRESFARRRLVARHAADAIDLGAVERHLVGRQCALDDDVAVCVPLLALRIG